MFDSINVPRLPDLPVTARTHRATHRAPSDPGAQPTRRGTCPRSHAPNASVEPPDGPRRGHRDQPLSQTPKRPPWQVIGVFDPDHTGQDFAYTVGLAEMGFHELHMWACPTDGSDPGADFRLSHRDLRSFLNRYAELLLSGELTVGSEFSDPLDAGMTHARVTVGAPVDPGDIEAFGASGNAKVIPLRWALDREPEGRDAPVLPGVAEQIARLTVEWRRLVAKLEGSSCTHPAGSAQHGPQSAIRAVDSRNRRDQTSGGDRGSDG